MRRRARGVKLSSIIFCVTVLLAGLPAGGRAQVNSGSNGSDGAFDPVTSTTINMATHPNGIYQYTSVNISSGVSVTFTPNANNTPVVWLVQSNCTINGFLYLAGLGGAASSPGRGGPGGYRGGPGGTAAAPGQGPGGGFVGYYGGNASYATFGSTGNSTGLPGPRYGNSFVMPLLGGSGGAGSSVGSPGGGGGGAILIAATGTITITGGINAMGGSGYGGGSGSGGAVRLVASKIAGTGSSFIDVSGGIGSFGVAGGGRVRFDILENDFSGSISGVFTQGYQPIIIPTAGQGAQLTIASVAGTAVTASPSGVLVTPDAVISSQQANPIPVVVSCANIPLNTPITVTVRPANGSTVSAVGYNNTGTLASSMATVSLNMPRGGGIIWATAATGN